MWFGLCTYTLSHTHMHACFGPQQDSIDRCIGLWELWECLICALTWLVFLRGLKVLHTWHIYVIRFWVSGGDDKMSTLLMFLLFCMNCVHVYRLDQDLRWGQIRVVINLYIHVRATWAEQVYWPEVQVFPHQGQNVSFPHTRHYFTFFFWILAALWSLDHVCHRSSWKIKVRTNP